jgi:hypothetical protein
MNCYYSNLIEGHDTHPVDIERALKSDYSAAAICRQVVIRLRARRYRRPAAGLAPEATWPPSTAAGDAPSVWLRCQSADSARSRPPFRDDLAHRSDLKSPTCSETISPAIPG